MSLPDAFSRLTVLEARFAEAYVGEANGNATEACRLAGAYPTSNRNTLKRRAYEMVRRPGVQEYIAALFEDDELVMSRQERLRTLTRIARGDTTDEKLDKDGMRVELRSSTEARLSAMAQLAKASGEKMRLEITTTADKLSDAELAGALAAAGISIAQLPVGRADEDAGTLDDDDTDEADETEAG